MFWGSSEKSIKSSSAGASCLAAEVVARDGRAGLRSGWSLPESFLECALVGCCLLGGPAEAGPLKAESKYPVCSGVVTSRMKMARIRPGFASARSVYTSRSASPLSPTRMNLRLGKSRRIFSNVPFFLSATGSKIPCSMPLYCFK